MNTEELDALIEEQENETANRKTATQNREALLLRLRSAGITRIAAEYKGYREAGGLGAITYDPETASFDAADKTLKDFLWQLACDNNAKFDRSADADGEIYWLVDTDTINIIHHQHYTTTISSAHQDL